MGAPSPRTKVQVLSLKILVASALDMHPLICACTQGLRHFCLPLPKGFLRAPGLAEVLPGSILDPPSFLGLSTLTLSESRSEYPRWWGVFQEALREEGWVWGSWSPPIVCKQSCPFLTLTLSEKTVRGCASPK